MSLLQDLMVLPVWLQVLVAEAHQTTCLGEKRMKIYSIMLDASCSTLMPCAIQAIDTSERRTDSPRAHTYV